MEHAADELKQYIKRHLSRGVSEDEIKNTLISIGHDPFSLSSIFVEVRDMIETEKKKEKKKKQISIAIFVVVMLVGICIISLLVNMPSVSKEFRDNRASRSINNPDIQALQNSSQNAQSDKNLCAKGTIYENNLLKIRGIKGSSLFVQGIQLCLINSMDGERKFLLDKQGNLYTYDGEIKIPLLKSRLIKLNATNQEPSSGKD